MGVNRAATAYAVGILLCMATTAGAVCGDPPIHCREEGESCVSKRVSECLPPMECPVALRHSGTCSFPPAECGNPPTHCKSEGYACTLRATSECKPPLKCSELIGVCQRQTTKASDSGKDKGKGKLRF